MCFVSVLGGVFIFYVVFFGALFGLFAICMKFMLWIYDDKQPRYLLDDSLIGSHPGNKNCVTFGDWDSSELDLKTQVVPRSKHTPSLLQ